MRYKAALAYLNSFIDYEKLGSYSYARSFKRERMQRLLAKIGNPHNDLRVIHIAGSKGKGSVCAFIASILKEAGFMVGLYTSPHLHDFRERIRILYKRKNALHAAQDFEGMISKQALAALVERLKPAIEHFKKYSRYGLLSFFEVYTALAFCYFKDKNVDFLILETGLGGRLDATNVCASMLCVITPISYEHTKYLGASLADIAYEKASIIKKENRISPNGRRIALTAAQHKMALRVIEVVAKRNHALLLKAGRHFAFSIKNNNVFHAKRGHSFKECPLFVFDYRGLQYELMNLRINLAGEHQVANASLAVASCQALRHYHIAIGAAAIRAGLGNCRWPARFEIIAKKPLIILDGAQNRASMQALAKTITQRFGRRAHWLIFGIAQDKELADTCRAVSLISENIILTKADNPRAMSPQRLAQYFPKTSRVLISESVPEALGLVAAKTNSNSLIVITGSLYVCAEARAIVRKRQGSIKHYSEYTA